MQHFSSVDKFNIFRLPVAWQYLQDTLGAPLNTANLGTYDKLVQACLQTGAFCIIDIHNYARWDGNIIGQSGGPTNDQFADLWSQLGKKYAPSGRVIMGLMNEPHDSMYRFCFFIAPNIADPSLPTVPDISAWATAVQGAVTAIRKAGATDNMILLPGTSYTSAGAFVSDGSAAALNGVKDVDNTVSKLIFDVHNYFDSDGSGTTAGCTSNKISDGFQPLVSFLKSNNRQALVSELGGGSSDASCLTNICAALDFLNENSDVYLGWVGWSAGSFQSSYVLSLDPSGGTDVPLVKQCFAGKFGGGGGNSTLGGGGNGTSTSSGETNPSSGGAGTGGGTDGGAAGGGGNAGGANTGAPQASITQPGTPGATGGSQAPFPVQNGTSTQPGTGTTGGGGGSGTCKARPSGSTGTSRRRRKRSSNDGSVAKKTRKMAGSPQRLA